MGLRDYIAKLPAPPEHWVNLGRQNVAENIELKTSVEAPLPEPEDKRYFEPNEAAWESFVRGDDDGQE